jgi:hypothetical protein
MKLNALMATAVGLRPLSALSRKMKTVTGHTNPELKVPTTVRLADRHHR